MSQGYLLIGLGQRYIIENYYLSSTIRKQGDTRPISILVNQEDYEYAKSANIFDDIIVYSPNEEDDLYKDCVNDFEKKCVYLRINLDKFCLYDETINLDSDVLCQCPIDKLWEYLNQNKFSIANLGNKVADPNWHWGYSNVISQILGKPIPSMHCGFSYIRKDDFSEKFFQLVREIFLQYDSYGCKRFFRGGRTEEAIYSIAYAKLDILPIGYTEFPVMTFNYSGDQEIPSNKQILLDENNRSVEMEDTIPFIHMFEKMDGHNYKEIYKKIME